MIDASSWVLGAAIASAIAASASLCVAWKNSRTQSKSVDFSNCLRVIEQLGEAQRRVFDAKDEPKRVFESRELLNLMEVLALLINDKKLEPSTNGLVTAFLEETWAYCRVDPAFKEIIGDAVTGFETFTELMKFGKRHKKRIDALVKAYQHKLQAKDAVLE